MFQQPHYNFFTDLNNDCVPDLFLTTEYKNATGYLKRQYEVYIQIYDEDTQKFMFCLTYMVESGPYATSAFLEDFDKDGAIDIAMFNQTSHNL